MPARTNQGMPRKLRRAKVTVEVEDDILDRLSDLHKQATVDRSHYYTGKCIRDAIAEIKMLRDLLALK